MKSTSNSSRKKRNRGRNRHNNKKSNDQEKPTSTETSFIECGPPATPRIKPMDDPFDDVSPLVFESLLEDVKEILNAEQQRSAAEINVQNLIDQSELSNQSSQRLRALANIPRIQGNFRIPNFSIKNHLRTFNYSSKKKF